MHPLLSFYWRTAVIVLGGAIALTGIPAAIVLMTAAGFGSGMCGTYVLEEVPSPYKKLKAVVFEIDCGATTGHNTPVAIVAANLDTKSPGSFPRGFFLAELDGGRVPPGQHGGPEVRVRWRSESMLFVEHHQFAQVIRANGVAGGVAIEYGHFSAGSGPAENQ